MKTLTKAEEEVMQVVWNKGKALLRDVVAEMPEPRPHQNTVATILKILAEKEFIGIESVGRMHLYYPLVSRESYSKGRVKSLVKKYYDGSFSNIVSAMVKENNLSIRELEMLVRQLKKKT